MNRRAGPDQYPPPLSQSENEAVAAEPEGWHESRRLRHHHVIGQFFASCRPPLHRFHLLDH